MQEKKKSKRFIENYILGAIFWHIHLKHQNICCTSAQTLKFPDERKVNGNGVYHKYEVCKKSSRTTIKKALLLKIKQ